MASNPTYSAAFRDATVAARQDHEGSEYISDDRDEEDDEAREHEDGDGCAIFATEYQVLRKSDDEGGEPEQIPVEDLEPGDLYQDPAQDAHDVWWLVAEVDITGDDVHVQTEH